jgi:hypothetical protein
MSGIEDAELNGVEDPHFERILRMSAHSCALRLLFIWMSQTCAYTVWEENEYQVIKHSIQKNICT